MKRCVCDKIASFGFINDKKPSCCKDCKKENMINIRHPKCKCGKVCNFGFVGKKATHCSKCKYNNMVDLNNKKCKCGKRPSFGFINDKKPVCCKDCKKEDMVSLYGKKCKCGKRCIFGYIDKKPVCCKDCKKEDMVDIKNRCSCGNKKVFGYSIPTKCFNCKEKNMLNIKCICKNKSKNFCHICKICICGNIALYGYKSDKKLICCKYCKKDDMLNPNTKKCWCGNRPLYGYKQYECCKHCKKDDMVLINSCKTSFCESYSNKKYDYYCTHCFSNLFPNDQRTLVIRKKSKEIKVVSFITNKLEGWLHDKPLYVDLRGGCCDSKRRIDLRKLINGTLLCIEIDEKQHKNYNQQDEKNRYDNLFMDFSGKYIFIRYNPDPYRLNGKTKNPKFETRMKSLLNEIQYQITRIKNETNTELVEIIKLFFDI